MRTPEGILISDELQALATKAQMAIPQLMGAVRMWQEQYGDNWVDKGMAALKERARQMKGVKPIQIMDSGDAVRL